MTTGHISNGIGLGMCRLAIVEIASGKQPASILEDSAVLTVVYNYRDSVAN